MELRKRRGIGKRRGMRSAEPNAGQWPLDIDANPPFEVNPRAQAQHATVVLGKHQHEVVEGRGQYQPSSQYSEDNATGGQRNESTDGSRRADEPAMKGATQTDVVDAPERVERLEMSPVAKKPKLEEAANSFFAFGEESLAEERKSEGGFVGGRVEDRDKTKDSRWVI